MMRGGRPTPHPFTGNLGLDLRRSKFAQQTYDERILLWMVVVITLSGVGMAALQLAASYRLAASGRGEFDKSGELSLERDRISLKSSVTGLFILVISFAFFFVFVSQIYVMKDADVNSQAESSQKAPQQIKGGLILPPAAGGMTNVKPGTKEGAK